MWLTMSKARERSSRTRTEYMEDASSLKFRNDEQGGQSLYCDWPRSQTGRELKEVIL